MTELGSGVEFDRIRAIVVALGPRAAEVGDDCALVPLNGGFLALSTDVSVEQVHFRREWLAPSEIGWRAAAAALADLAAAGADPVGILVALTVPPGTPEPEVVALMEGAGEAASVAGAQVLGGDLSAGATLQLAVTVVGSTGRWLGRSGAQPGDLLWVTGALGGARAALGDWLAGGSPTEAGREAFAHPVPRIQAGRWLAAAGAHAMIDLSDGLAGDLGHLATASQVRAEVDLGALPVHPALATLSPREAALAAAQGGEDYELLAALPPEFTGDEARRCLAETGVPLTCIGAVTEGQGAVLLWQGAQVGLTGYSHRL